MSHDLADDHELPPGPVIFRWTPPPGFAEHEYEDIAEEYAVVERKVHEDGKDMTFTVVHARYHGKWMANPWSTRPLIRELLRKLREAKLL